MLLYVKNTEIKNPPNFFKGLIEVIKTNRLVDFIDSKFREPYLSKLNNSFKSYKSLIRTILDPKYEPIKEDIRSYIASIPKYLLIAFSLSIPIGFLYKFLTFQDAVCVGGGCTLVDKFQASVFPFIIDSFLLIGILIIALPFLVFVLSSKIRTRLRTRYFLINV